MAFAHASACLQAAFSLVVQAENTGDADKLNMSNRGAYVHCLSVSARHTSDL